MTDEVVAGEGHGHLLVGGAPPQVPSPQQGDNSQDAEAGGERSDHSHDRDPSGSGDRAGCLRDGPARTINVRRSGCRAGSGRRAPSSDLAFLVAGVIRLNGAAPGAFLPSWAALRAERSWTADELPMSMT